jgi:hypothetical protein
MHIAVSDCYDNVSVFSIYWKSDDTGGAEDSSLFIQTLSKLQNVQTCQQSLSDDVSSPTPDPKERRVLSEALVSCLWQEILRFSTIKNYSKEGSLSTGGYVITLSF